MIVPFLFVVALIMRLKTAIILGGDNDSQSKEERIYSGKTVFEFPFTFPNYWETNKCPVTLLLFCVTQYLDIGVGRAVCRLWGQWTIYCRHSVMIFKISPHDKSMKEILFPFYR